MYIRCRFVTRNYLPRRCHRPTLHRRRWEGLVAGEPGLLSWKSRMDSVLTWRAKPHILVIFIGTATQGTNGLLVKV